MVRLVLHHNITLQMKEEFHPIKVGKLPSMAEIMLKPKSHPWAVQLKQVTLSPNHRIKCHFWCAIPLHKIQILSGISAQLIEVMVPAVTKVHKMESIINKITQELTLAVLLRQNSMLTHLVLLPRLIRKKMLFQSGNRFWDVRRRLWKCLLSKENCLHLPLIMENYWSKYLNSLKFLSVRRKSAYKPWQVSVVSIL